MRYVATHIDVQIRATKALLKFCEDHGYQTHWLKNVRNSLFHLEAGNIKDAYLQFEVIPKGGIGTFNDWFPPVIHDHENEEYAWAVFEALCTHWSLTMELGKQAHSE